MPILKNKTYDGVNDPTAERLADIHKMGQLNRLSYEERLKMLSTSGWCSFNWAEQLLAAANK